MLIKQQTNLISYFLYFYINEVSNEFGYQHRVEEGSTEISTVHAANPAQSHTVSTYKNLANMTTQSLWKIKLSYNCTLFRPMYWFIAYFLTNGKYI